MRRSLEFSSRQQQERYSSGANRHNRGSKRALSQCQHFVRNVTTHRTVGVRVSGYEPHAAANGASKPAVGTAESPLLIS